MTNLGAETSASVEVQDSHGQFMLVNKERERKLVEQGFRFIGNLRPPRISGISYDDQERSFSVQSGDAELTILGDVMSVCNHGAQERELIFKPDYCAVYAPSQEQTEFTSSEDS